MLAQVSDFVAPHIDYHAFGPELALVGALVWPFASLLLAYAYFSAASEEAPASA